MIDRQKRRGWVAGAAVLAAASLLATTGSAASASSGSLPGFTDGYAVNEGIRIHYTVAGHGPPLVLLHGWPETLQAWSQVAPALARDHTVIAVDLPPSTTAARRGGAPGPAEQRRYIAAYSRPGSSHAGFEYFRQQEDGEKAVDRLITGENRLTMPVLGAGGQYSMAGLIGAKLQRVATHVTPAVLPNANHWVLEENPQEVTALLQRFLAR